MKLVVGENINGGKFKFYWKKDEAKIEGPKIGRANPVQAQPKPVLRVLFWDLRLSRVLFTINIMSR